MTNYEFGDVLLLHFPQSGWPLESKGQESSYSMLETRTWSLHP
ncbi:MAG: hypothetical protein U0805_20360 [Pirellulales bacterium]